MVLPFALFISLLGLSLPTAAPTYTTAAITK
jgi:hypothetical protein